jgi:DNA-binding PadR family transcriptional regulator
VAGGYVTVEKTFVANRPRTVYRMTEEGRVAIRRYRRQVGDVLAQIDAT